MDFTVEVVINCLIYFERQNAYGKWKKANLASKETRIGRDKTEECLNCLKFDSIIIDSGNFYIISRDTIIDLTNHWPCLSRSAKLLINAN